MLHLLLATALQYGVPICNPSRLQYHSRIERIDGFVKMTLRIGPGRSGPCALVYPTRRHVKFIASGEGIGTTAYIEAPEKTGTAQFLDRDYDLVGYIRVDSLARMHGYYTLDTTLLVSRPYEIPPIVEKI